MITNIGIKIKNFLKIMQERGRREKKIERKIHTLFRWIPFIYSYKKGICDEGIKRREALICK